MPDRSKGHGAIDWDDLYPRLLGYAISRLGRVPNRNDIARDVVQTAIVRLQKRKGWNPSEEEFDRYMINAVRSAISNYRKSADNRNLVYGEDETVLIFPDIRRNQEEDLEYRQQEEEMLKYIGKRSPDARECAEIILWDDLIISREIAERMNVKSTRVDYLKKKLRDIVSSYVTYLNGKLSSPAQRILSRTEGGLNNEK